MLGAVLARRRLCVDGVRGNRHRCELQPFRARFRKSERAARRREHLRRGTEVAGEEFAGGDDEESADAYAGNIVDRSFARGGATVGVATTTGKKAKSNPVFNFGFEGLNHYQQRYSRGGNQFSVEPPDQGMCVGNGYVVEAVNDVFNVFSQATGASLLPDNTATNIVAGFPRNVNHAVDLNSFYGYAPAINRDDRACGAEFVTDPSCIYDAADAAVLRRRAHPRSASARPMSGCVQLREPPRPRGQPDVEPDGQLEHLPDRCHERWHEHRRRESGPVPRRLSAHRC